MWRLILLFLVALAGLWFGKEHLIRQTGTQKIAHINPEAEFPLTEHKSFVIVLYAHNQAAWCKRALRSIFEQDYNHYRVAMIDDASIDGTEQLAKEFILANNQDEKVIFIRNETFLGPVASLYRIIDNCLNREIIIPLEAKDWFASPNVLNRFNLAYQNPDVWMATGWAIEYPAYKMREEGPISYYAALFKEVRLSDLLKKGRFLLSSKVYLQALKKLSGGRIKYLDEPLGFLNLAPSIQQVEEEKVLPYGSLGTFPESKAPKCADIVIRSENRPLQLYACLESIQRYVAGFENLIVLYRADDAYASGYKTVQDAFPAIHFFPLKEGIEKAPSEYILLGNDDLIVKDFVNLKLCVEQMEKTGSYRFYLDLGRNISDCPPSQPLSFGIYAWELEMGEGDWATKQEHPAHPALVRKKEEKQEHPIGLYFENSKVVSTGEKNREELLAIFNQGLKIHIDALHKIENRSVVLDDLPEFVAR